MMIAVLSDFPPDYMYIYTFNIHSASFMVAIGWVHAAGGHDINLVVLHIVANAYIMADLY